MMVDSMDMCVTKRSRQKRTTSRYGIIVLLSVVICQFVGGGRAWGQVDLQVSSQRDLVPQYLLGLLHAPEVHRELGLSPFQVEQLENLFGQIDGDWFRARNLPVDKQRAQVAEQEKIVLQWFDQHGTERQRKRLTQLEMQAQSMRILLRPDLARKLSMTSDQVDRMAELAIATKNIQQRLREATRRNQATDPLREEVTAAVQAEQDGLQTVMKPEQLETLEQLLGKPFDTGQLKRIYPMAPELVPTADWINSRPVTLKSLRGKIVLVHFYAFECHNCHANFDHYRQWHQKYGDDVVVLGIQTPETPTERQVDAVKQAARERNLEFPILVDLDSANWKAWSNTMWPTVYVIDRDGYLRPWWQGELNWKGATGDQTIEQLIDELRQE